MTEDNH